MVLKIKNILLFLSLFFINIIIAQPEKILFATNEYVPPSELLTLLEKLKNAPIIHKECLDVDCEKIKVYNAALFNLDNDLKNYAFYLEWAKQLYKKQWEQYYKNNYDNVEMNLELQYGLMLSELLSNGGTITLDVINIYSTIKNPRSLDKISDKLYLLVDAIDALLSFTDIITKYVKSDPGTNLLTEAFSSTVYNYYTAISEKAEIVKTSLENMGDIKEYFGAWKTMSKKERLVKLDNPSFIGVMAAIGNLLGLVATNEQNKLKAEIKGLDDLLITDQKFQAEVFKRYHYHYKLLDIINDIRFEIAKREPNLRSHSIKCNQITTKFPRIKKFNPPNKNSSYTDGLKYYKPFITFYSETLDKSWEGIKDCSNPLKPYKLVITDGMGNPFYPPIKITRLSDNIKMFEGASRYKKSHNLSPDHYKIEIKESTTLNNLKIEQAIIPKLTINESTKSEIILNPYGRINLDVVDKDNNPLPFGYEFSINGEVIAYKFTITPDSEIIDLPANVDMDLVLKYKWETKKEKNISIKAGQMNKLRYIYDNKKFTKEASPTEPIKNEPNLNDVNPESSNAHIPQNWVKGTLFNSNNGTCEHKGKVLIFKNNNSKFLNLKTNKISEDVIVLPGEKLEVAIPKESTFLRVSPSKTNSITDTSAREQGISFLRMKTVHNGWWYSVGCKNGTRPSKLCDNGKGETVYGSAGNGNCGTMGE